MTGSQEFNTISVTGYKKNSFIFKSQLSYCDTNSAEEEPEMWLKAPEELAFRHWVKIFFSLPSHHPVNISGCGQQGETCHLSDCVCYSQPLCSDIEGV